MHLFELHNEHRLATVRLVAELSNLILGHIDFRFIVLMGNLSLVGILAVLVLEWGRFRGPPLYLVVLTVLLYTPQPWQNMVWATTAVQSNVVNACAVAAVWGLFDRRAMVSLVVPAACATAATFTSGAGLFVFPILLLAGLARWFDPAAESGGEKVEPKALPWPLVVITATMLIMGAAYFWGYESPSHSEYVRGDSVLVGLRFLLALIGAVAGTSGASMGLGIAVLLAASALTARRAWRRSPVFYWMLIYLLLVAVVVAVSRSGQGVDYALTARYRIHSLLVILSTIASAVGTWQSLMGRRSVVVVVCCAVLLMYCRDFRNTLDILPERRAFVIGRTAQWVASGKGLQYPPRMMEHAAAILEESIRKGVYTLPQVVEEQAEMIRARMRDG